MRCLCLLAMSALASGGIAQSTWYVDDVGPGPGSGTSADPYVSISYALAQPNVASGDSVIVRDGTYLDEAVNFLGKDVAVRSQSGPDFTTIVGIPGDAPSHPVVRFENGETANAVLQGFTITGGSGVYGCAGAYCVAGGGGLLCLGASPTIVDCRFVDNYCAEQGGGVYAENSSLLIRDCFFDDNHADEGSGIALRDCDAVIQDCQIRLVVDGLLADQGGAIYAEDSDVLIVNGDVRDVMVNYHVAGLGFRDCNVTLRGCTIAGNRSYEEDGGGVSVRGGTCSIQDCSISGNLGYNGGGVFLEACSAEILDCTFDDNGASDRNTGGAIHAGSTSLTIEQCTFTRNSAASGGAVALWGDSLDVDGCVFSQNLAQGHPHSLGSGGALWVLGGLTLVDSAFDLNHAEGFFDTPGGALYASVGPVDVRGCSFTGNSAKQGGAIAIGASGCVESSLFVGNEASGAYGDSSYLIPTGGGAVFVSGQDSNLVASKCLLAANVVTGPPSQAPEDGRGGAVFGEVVLDRCTVVENVALTEGGGVEAGCLVSCIVRGNEPDELAPSVVATYSSVRGGWGGTGNIDTAPLFVDAPHQNYHLAPGSPCINSGDPAAPLDLDGSRADMGAFQFVDCNGNGLLDSEDIGSGTSADLNGNGFPDECECFAYNYCEAAPHSTGPGATMGLGGSASVSQNSLVLVASGCPPNKNGIFFYGPTQFQAAFGDGWRCVFGQVFRLPVVNSGPQGIAAYAVDLDSPPQPSGQITPGSRWNFQFWFRDPQGPGGSGLNLTDGLEILFCP